MATGYRPTADLQWAERSALEHPFCARWATGQLHFQDLALYASEYEHAVTAIAAAAARVAALDPTRADFAAEKQRRVSCWRDFSRAVGWGGMAAWTYAEEPLSETLECADAWRGDDTRTVDEHLRILRAIDAMQGAVGEVMLNGLLRHYGFEEGPATEYFRLHTGTVEEPQSAINEEVNRSYWLLLDGVESLARR
ncbi:MAG TPA: hypothetical protein VJL81_04780 [Solirubrobacterales bacterium]|nr:hypothetical protein [Solirubrobacterales bacterium]